MVAGASGASLIRMLGITGFVLDTEVSLSQKDQKGLAPEEVRHGLHKMPTQRTLFVLCVMAKRYAESAFHDAGLALNFHIMEVPIREWHLFIKLLMSTPWIFKPAA